MFLSMANYFDWVEDKTERALTKRKAKKVYKKAHKRTFLSELWSWIDALLFAIFFVLLINQFLFQLFVIPSPSMVHTLEVGDRVIVNKDSYGVELYPAGPKIMTSGRNVERDNIITFYNPEYDSKGPFFDVLSQVVYMGTLTLVNIDKDENGNPRERLYVKRAVGMPGDVVSFENGDVMILPGGTDEFVSEYDFRSENGLSLSPNRIVNIDAYPGLEAAAAITAYSDNNLMSYLPNEERDDYLEIQGTDDDWIFDRYEFEKERYKTLEILNPSDMSYRSQSAKYQNGIYVPTGYVLPLGDNRDNSHDGRYFGPVEESDINGRVIGRFWPLNRIGNLTDD